MTHLYKSRDQLINYISTLKLGPVYAESFRLGLSLKPGLKPENCFKSYAYKET
jgi:hypothetical protein